MSYLQFLLVFLLPPLLLLYGLPRRARPAREPLALLALPVIALLYTTPWDNYLVATGVWAYGSERVLGTIGWVPVEEYAFMLLQPLLSVGWLTRMRLHEAPIRPAPRLRGGGALAWLGLALAGGLLIGHAETRYLGLILAWAAPVLAAQWWLTGDVARHAPARYVLTVAVPVLYLWVADASAIGADIWRISERYTVGVAPFGLPIEEMTFFLVTHLLAVHGALLFLQPSRLAFPVRSPAH